MPFYKQVVNMDEVLHHNAKKYSKGDVVQERVQLSESEFAFHEKHPELTGCKFIPVDGKQSAPAGKKANETKSVDEMKIPELAEVCNEKGIDISDLNLKAPASKKILKERIAEHENSGE